MPDIYKIVFWKDQIKVFDFETGLYPEFTISLANVGDGPVMISQIFVILPPHGFNVGYRIAQTLGPGESISFAGGQVFSPDYGGYIYTESGTVNETVLNNSGSPWPEQNARPCFGDVLFIESSFLLGRMRSQVTGGKLVEASVQAFVLYYSLHDRKEVREPFPVVATFVRSTDQKCAELGYRD